MYKCKNCGMEFKTMTEWKNHEFNCVNYIVAQINELEQVREYLRDETAEFNYEVKPEEFKDCDDIIHKSIHFKLHIQFNDGTKMDITDKSEDLKSGWLTSSEDIIKYIESEMQPKELSEYEKAVIEFYSAS